MTEQLSMDEMLAAPEVTEEEQAFTLLYSHLSDLLIDAPIDSKLLFLEHKSSFTSVYFMENGSLFLRFSIRKKERFVEIPDRYVDLFPSVSFRTFKSVPGMALIPVSGFADVLDYVPQLRAMLDAMSRQFKDFGCCGHYLECSDAKACVHSDPRFALSCCYFYNLRDGKIFYGKNRNI